MTKLFSCGEVSTLGKDVLAEISITSRKAISYQFVRTVARLVSREHGGVMVLGHDTFVLDEQGFGELLECPVVLVR